MRTARFVAVLLVVSVPVAWAASGSQDGAMAHRLVISRSDARALYHHFVWAWPAKALPCQMPVEPDHGMTAAATGNWGGVQSQLWSTASVARAQSGAARLYDDLLDAAPTCLLRTAQGGTPTYKQLFCNTSARLSRLWAGRYGDRSSAWRAVFSSHASPDGVCTLHALDGVIVQTGRAVAYYLFDNVYLVNSAVASRTTAQDEAIVGRAVGRVAA